MIQYLIDSTDIKTLGVYVSDSTGVLDTPKPKNIQKYNWREYHGSMVDLRNICLEERNIILKCFMVASSEADFVSKRNSLAALFSAGSLRLTININDISIVCGCYLSKEIAIKKCWRNGTMIGEFDLNLCNADPLDYVILRPDQPLILVDDFDTFYLTTDNNTLLTI